MNSGIPSAGAAHARVVSSRLISAAVAAAIGTSLVAPTTYAADDELAEITVTGSRIVRRDLDAPSPILTVSSDTFEASSTTSAESVLNQLPQFSPTGTQFASSIQSGATASPGAATLNLRGLGTNRNLVLVDGRRPQPANASLVVDVNTIPAAAIQSVEVITGGASATYGPDAMAGVVNFILKKNFQGLSLDLQTGRTQEGDGEETRVSALMGTNFAEGHGNIMLGMDWNKREAVYQIDRNFYRNGWLDPGNPGGGFITAPAYGGGQVLGTGTNSPSQVAINSLFPQAPAGSIGPATEFRFNADGSVFVTKQGYGYNGPLNSLTPGRYSAIKKLANGDLDQSFIDGYVSTPLTRYSIFGRGTYDINDNVSGFMQMNYNNVKVTQRGGLPPAVTIWQAPIPRDSRTLPAALNTLLASRAQPNADWSLYQVMDYNGPVQPVSTSNVWQLTAGLQGKLPFKDWTWEAYGTRGETSVDFDEKQLPSLQLYQKMVAAANFGVNAAVAGTPSNGGYTLRCTSGLPVFTNFTPSADCLNNLQSNLHNFTKLTQDVFEANLQGAAFNLPAGEVRTALGVSYRKNDFSYKVGNPQADILDNPIGLFASNDTGGSTNVKEVYGEALVPVIKRLNLELGYRFSDFNTAGGTSTYKALFTWKALDAVTFRGGYQFATRAPNVAELFTGRTQNVVTFTGGDPCSVSTRLPYGNLPPGNTFSPTPSNPNYLKVQALCRAIIGNNTSAFDTQNYNTPAGPNGFTRQTPPFFPLEIELVQGNVNVKPEKGRTWTLGAVITDPFGWNGLSVTLDAYRIELSDAIAPVSSRTVYDLCFNANGTSNPNLDVSNEWCKLIGRNPVTGDRANVLANYSNLGTVKTQGLDVSVAWSMQFGPGKLVAGTQLNYLDKFDYQTSPAAPLVHAKGTLDQGGQYKWRALSTLGYRWDTLGVNLSWRFLSSVENAAFSLDPATTIKGTGAYSLFGLNANYSFSDKYQVRAGIDNLLNRQPSVVGNNPGVDSNTDQTLPGYYDALGRRFYVGLKATF